MTDAPDPQMTAEDEKAVRAGMQRIYDAFGETTSSSFRRIGKDGANHITYANGWPKPEGEAARFAANRDAAIKATVDKVIADQGGADPKKVRLHIRSPLALRRYKADEAAAFNEGRDQPGGEAAVMVRIRCVGEPV